MKLFLPISIFLICFIPVSAQKTVKVKTVQEFYNAIASNTVIELAPGDYHLEQVDTAQKNPACNWSLVLFDEIYENETQEEDKTLLISGLENLTIRAQTKGKDSVRILTNRRAASVLAFKGCSNLQLDGIVFGHDVVKYDDPNDLYISFCSGEVLEFFDCNKITLKSNVLFGCGTRGFLAHRCKNIVIEKTIIKDCTYGLFGVFDCENILFKKCSFHYKTYHQLMEISGCNNLTAKKTAIYNCVFSEYGESEVKVESSENIHPEQIRIRMMSNKEFFNMGDEMENHTP
ncbi:MAG TPA: right-handed parallel beta-helix repeat-containing protein [Flavobacteriales bacterium]|nr:right-handed parallel beta-helix repeat-containing protein [Flavobacteriales bacterium]